MYNDEFRQRYTTVPFAVYKARNVNDTKEVITHYHKEIEIIAMIEGSAEFYVNSQAYPVSKGDILIVPPYALHRGRMAQDTKTSYDCICFDLQLLCDESLKKELESQETAVISIDANAFLGTEQLCAYIAGAVLACDKKEAGWELEAVGYMSLLFGALKKNQFVRKGSGGSRETAFVEKVMEYLRQSLSEPITSKDVANKLYMNHSYFCRVFKKMFGCTFERYVLIYRLEKARLYLANTALPVTEIAFCLGFRNCSYFDKTFKAHFNITPLAYRKGRNK